MRRPALYLHHMQNLSTRRSRARERMEAFCFGALGMTFAFVTFLCFI